MSENETRREPVISFRELTRETYGEVLRLKVAESQNGLVASNCTSVAQAYFHPEAYFRGIYAGVTPVGFFMLEQWPEKSEYALWRFMIDAGHQRMGFGRRALEMIIEYVRSLPGATELLLSHREQDGHPGPFYERLGFEYTGEVDDGEMIMRLGLNA